MVRSKRTSARTGILSKTIKEAEPSRKRRTFWTEQEDAVLVAVLNEHGGKGWPFIATELRTSFPRANRSGKSCRLRWKNWLDPAIDKSDWKAEEMRRIIELHMELGNKWVDISRSLQGSKPKYRTDNAIKNLWNSFLKHSAKDLTLALAPSSSTSSEEDAEPSFSGPSMTSTMADVSSINGGVGQLWYPDQSTIMRPHDPLSGFHRIPSPLPSYMGNMSFPASSSTMALFSPPRLMQSYMQPIVGELPPRQPSGPPMFPGEFGYLYESDNVHLDGVMIPVADVDFNRAGPGDYYPIVQATPGSAAGLTSPLYSHEATYMRDVEEFDLEELPDFSRLLGELPDGELEACRMLLDRPTQIFLRLSPARLPWRKDLSQAPPMEIIAPDSCQAGAIGVSSWCC